MNSLPNGFGDSHIKVLQSNFDNRIYCVVLTGLLVYSDIFLNWVS